MFESNDPNHKSRIEIKIAKYFSIGGLQTNYLNETQSKK